MRRAPAQAPPAARGKKMTRSASRGISSKALTIRASRRPAGAVARDGGPHALRRAGGGTPPRARSSSSATSTSPSASSTSPCPGFIRRNLMVRAIMTKRGAVHRCTGPRTATCRGGRRHRRARARGRRRARRRRRWRAGRRARPPTATACAARAASSGSSPSARRAASVEECVQPEPCAAPSGWRSPGDLDQRARRRRTRSIASSRCPPVTTTARGPSAWTARASSSPSSVRVAREHPRLGQVGRDDGGPRRASARRAPPAASGVEQPRAGLGDHHRVDDDRRARPAAGRAPPPPPRSLGRAAEHPDLDRVDADVLDDGPHLRDDHRRRDGCDGRHRRRCSAR